MCVWLVGAAGWGAHRGDNILWQSGNKHRACQPLSPGGKNPRLSSYCAVAPPSRPTCAWKVRTYPAPLCRSKQSYCNAVIGAGERPPRPSVSPPTCAWKVCARHDGSLPPAASCVVVTKNHTSPAGRGPAAVQQRQSTIAAGHANSSAAALLPLLLPPPAPSPSAEVRALEP